jgi:hypothetical protein
MGLLRPQRTVSTGSLWRGWSTGESVAGGYFGHCARHARSKPDSPRNVMPFGNNATPKLLPENHNVETWKNFGLSWTNGKPN